MIGIIQWVAPEQGIIKAFKCMLCTIQMSSESELHQKTA